MESKTALQEEKNKKTPGIIQIEKKDTGNIMFEKVAEKKQRKRVKISSALLAASLERRAFDAVVAFSSRELIGFSGLENKGTINSSD